MSKHLWYAGFVTLAVTIGFLLNNLFFRDYVVSPIQWRNGETELCGSLYLPKTQGPHPCIVIVHGSGNLSRFGKSGEIYRDHGAELSKRGIAVAIYDKRGCGNSTGDWKTANLDELADDVNGLVDLLRKREDIDKTHLGLMGFSQGSWVSIIAASKSAEKVSFLITLSGSANTPAEQGHFILESALRSKGFSAEQVNEAIELDKVVTEVYRSNTGWEEARLAINDAKSKEWFKASSIGIQNEDSWNWKWYRDLPFDFDPKPILAGLQIPVLAIFGTHDSLVSTRDGIEMINNFLESGLEFEAIEYRNCDHLLLQVLGGRWSAPDGYWKDLTTWLERKNITVPIQI